MGITIFYNDISVGKKERNLNLAVDDVINGCIFCFREENASKSVLKRMKEK